MKACDEATVLASRGNRVYYPPPDARAEVDKATSSVLKAFTTEVASRYCSDQAVAQHWKAVAGIATAIKDAGLGKVYVKGGLALHHLLIGTMQKLAKDMTQDEDIKALKAATEYMQRTYASTSDLDAGLMLSDAEDALPSAAALVGERLAEMRDGWLDQEDMLAGIVAKCNSCSNDVLNKLRADGYTSVVFHADRRRDQTVDLVGEGEECPMSKCLRVTSFGSDSAIYLSENAGVYAENAGYITDFYLWRAKWAVSATLTREAGKCAASCPAELVDIAIPRGADSARMLSLATGTMNMKTTFSPVPGVSLPVVNMKNQLIDLRRMLVEHQKGIESPKITKRMYRYVILKFLWNLLSYDKFRENEHQDDEELYHAFIASTRWISLVHIKGIDDEDLHKHIKGHLENSKVDQTLMHHLFAIRDAVRCRDKPLTYHLDDFRARMGGGGAQIASHLGLVSLTVVAAALGSASSV